MDIHVEAGETEKNDDSSVTLILPAKKDSETGTEDVVIDPKAMFRHFLYHTTSLNASTYEAAGEALHPFVEAISLQQHSRGESPTGAEFSNTLLLDGDYQNIELIIDRLSQIPYDEQAKTRILILNLELFKQYVATVPGITTEIFFEAFVRVIRQVAKKNPVILCFINAEEIFPREIEGEEGTRGRRDTAYDDVPKFQAILDQLTKTIQPVLIISTTNDRSKMYPDMAGLLSSHIMRVPHPTSDQIAKAFSHCFKAAQLRAQHPVQHALDTQTPNPYLLNGLSYRDVILIVNQELNRIAYENPTGDQTITGDKLDAILRDFWHLRNKRLPGDTVRPY
jgi:hypothetical protein